ncbi:MAG: ankyrin repeat domain-containing protein [Candidatus Hydrogenedentes bacterium]|nr:ankyrin repeat domain-containing protein [Candidatus Hydrogenedentota bacterium]
MMARIGLSIVLILVAFSCGNKPLPEADNANTGDPESVLAEAIAKGDLQTVQSVLDSNPDALYSVDMMGQTPLHYAARTNNKEIIELLLEKGADPGIMNDEGVTPADTARAAGASQEIIDLLQGQ